MEVQNPQETNIFGTNCTFLGLRTPVGEINSIYFFEGHLHIGPVQKFVNNARRSQQSKNFREEYFQILIPCKIGIKCGYNIMITKYFWAIFVLTLTFQVKKYPKYQNSQLPWVNFGSTCIWNMLDSNNVETSDWHNFNGSWFSKHTFLMSFALTWSKYSLATNVELLHVIQTIVFNGVVGNDTSSQ